MGRYTGSAIPANFEHGSGQRADERQARADALLCAVTLDCALNERQIERFARYILTGEWK